MSIRVIHKWKVEEMEVRSTFHEIVISETRTRVAIINAFSMQVTPKTTRRRDLFASPF